jgi:hypothetical protein
MTSYQRQDAAARHLLLTAPPAHQAPPLQSANVAVPQLIRAVSTTPSLGAALLSRDNLYRQLFNDRAALGDIVARDTPPRTKWALDWTDSDTKTLLL